MRTKVDDETALAAFPLLVEALRALVPEFGSVDETPELQDARAALKAARCRIHYVWVHVRDGDGWRVAPVDADNVRGDPPTYGTEGAARHALDDLLAGTGE